MLLKEYNRQNIIESELLDSIRDDGIQEPIWVEPLLKGKYLVVDGNRRVECLRVLRESKKEFVKQYHHRLSKAGHGGFRVPDTDLEYVEARIISNMSNAYLDMDYIIPLSKGGKSGPSNLQTLCLDCHRKKDISSY